MLLLFPNGGIRNTFEARGYSAWDPSSPAFIVDDTLCIPTIFIAYTGESLDYKAPLLKALRAVDKAAVDVCQYFNPEVKKVVAYLGWEQEYFLVDEGLYAARPDLLMTGRTLMGHDSAKNQQLEDHYFGAIPSRVAAFMKELEIEALKLGIPVKARHNEVAPNQFELAPVFEECNLAVDHNMLIMALMRKVARNHGFRVLLHKSPSRVSTVAASIITGRWVRTPVSCSTHPANCPRPAFITFVVNTLMAVYRHNGLLKAFHLQCDERPPAGCPTKRLPAIISSFLGKQLTSAGTRRREHQGRSRQPQRQARHEAGHPADSGTDDDRQYRPQPHQPVRLHRQPLRAPRRGFRSQLRQCHHCAELRPCRAVGGIQERCGRTD